VVARAYIDQLTRSKALAPKQIAELEDVIGKVQAHPNRKKLTQLNVMAENLDTEAAQAKTPADAKRMRALSAILKQNGM
jgi:hypothetical protein